jgi:ferredoxin
MTKELREIASEWLSTGKVQGIFGLREEHGHIAPHLFTKTDELNSLVNSSKHPYLNTCRPSKRDVLYLIQKNHPDAKIGVVAKGCDERILVELAKRDQLNLEKIEILGVACTKDDAVACRCPKPYPTNIMVGEKVEGVVGDQAVDDLLKKSLPERLAFWKEQLAKCMKCYGCRNACAMCVCQECKLEQDMWVKTGELPPEFPLFHLIRAYHLADKCIECGECEKACPVDIPLLSIYKLMRRDIKELFEYEAGADVKQEAPLVTTLDETPIRSEE